MSAGRLVVCPTPIGNLEDVTLRVLAALRVADVVACEDTRRTGVLLDRYGVAARRSSPTTSTTSARARPPLVERIGRRRGRRAGDRRRDAAGERPGLRARPRGVAAGVRGRGPAGRRPRRSPRSSRPACPRTRGASSGSCRASASELAAVFARAGDARRVRVAAPRSAASLAVLAVARPVAARGGLPRADEDPRGGRARAAVVAGGALRRGRAARARSSLVVGAAAAAADGARSRGRRARRARRRGREGAPGGGRRGRPHRRPGERALRGAAGAARLGRESLRASAARRTARRRSGSRQRSSSSSSILRSSPSDVAVEVALHDVDLLLELAVERVAEALEHEARSPPSMAATASDERRDDERGQRRAAAVARRRQNGQCASVVRAIVEHCGQTRCGGWAAEDACIARTLSRLCADRAPIHAPIRATPARAPHRHRVRRMLLARAPRWPSRPRAALAGAAGAVAVAAARRGRSRRSRSLPNPFARGPAPRHRHRRARRARRCVAPCRGPRALRRPVPGRGRAVTVACGPLVATYLELATSRSRARRGGRRRDARSARSPRRTSSSARAAPASAHGYVDPLTLLRAARPPPLGAAPARAPRRRRRARRAAPPRADPPERPRPERPAPAWLGLGPRRPAAGAGPARRAGGARARRGGDAAGSGRAARRGA